MKKFIENNFVVIVLFITLFGFFKSCGDSRELTKMRKEVETIKNTTYSKEQLDLRLKIEGLKTEKRMIQSTDRRILDVNRQTEIDNEIVKLESKLG